MSTCIQCQSNFTARTVGGKPQRYCSPLCRKRAEKARDKARVATPPAVIRLTVGGNSPAASLPTQLAPQGPLEVEWLDVFPDLHRCVAGRLNKAQPGKSVFREDAIGNDRAPLGHAIMSGGEWRGKVRRNSVVIWASEPLASLDEAKGAVEAQLAGRPELIAESLKLAA